LITYQGIDLFETNEKTVVTIGTFDGVHLGHLKIIEQLIADAKQENCKSVILTFFPHPRLVLQGEHAIKLLNTIQERTALLAKTGVDCLIIHPFDQAFSALSAEQFIKTILVEKLHVKKIIVGHDHRFGHNRTANFDDLVQYGKQYSFAVDQIEAETYQALNVSSTKIRNALHTADVKLANAYLGHRYQLSGTVELGNQLGRTLGFPTANLQLGTSYKLIPKNGVYLVLSKMDSKLVYGLMNIGLRPTINGSTQTIEVHFLDFNADLYGQEITVELVDFLRDEIKFDSLTELKAQIEKDLIWATKAIATREQLAQ
jgi:riboflavin kinase/FMN adenylyltransferase